MTRKISIIKELLEIRIVIRKTTGRYTDPFCDFPTFQAPSNKHEPIHNLIPSTHTSYFLILVAGMHPIKRRKLELSTSNVPEILSQKLLSDVCADVDHEIALKQQLSATLESRIEWGLLLQESIEKGALIRSLLVFDD